uniref:Uncharacterized protein n=1 Tax=Streptomyces sp. NBC_00093 TaxID=2975649 RepID=A0AAU1ZZG4_9ACTN
MTHQPHTGHRAVIQDALEDWWLNTDPREPFNTHTVAGLVEDYLTHAGYQIAPGIPRTHVPTRLSVIVSSLLVLVCLASALGSAIRSDWIWAAIGLAAGLAYAHEVLGDIAKRRHYRSTRR